MGAYLKHIDDSVGHQELAVTMDKLEDRRSCCDESVKVPQLDDSGWMVKAKMGCWKEAGVLRDSKVAARRKVMQ